MYANTNVSCFAQKSAVPACARQVRCGAAKLAKVESASVTKQYDRALSGQQATTAAVKALTVEEAIEYGEPGLIASMLRSAPVQWYLMHLERAPLATKQWTSCSGFVLGDLLAQALTEPHFAVERTVILGLYGFLIDAPAGHAFYDWLDSNIEPGRAKTAAAVGKKIAIDQFIYAPVFTCVLFAYLQIMNGDPTGIPDALQSKVLPTLLANYAVWPLAHALNFYFVPTEQRILYNNFIAICWTTWLSCLAH